MKKDIIEIFSELGRRLSVFGSNEETEKVIRQACLENPWFLPGETMLAAKNIAGGMLSPDSLRKWIYAYPALPVSKPKNVMVIMAGNIPFVGSQDLLCVLAAGHTAVVKLSSKDAVLMAYLISELLDIAPDLPVRFEDSLASPDAVIAMGGDNAVRLFQERYAGIPRFLRGSRSSSAILSGQEEKEMLSGLAEDIFLYSGLGCRNVSLVWVPRGYDMSLLTSVLSSGREINSKYINNYRQTKALLQMNEQPFIDCNACLLCNKMEFPSAVSCINYAFYDNLSEVEDWISDHDSEIQCVSGNMSHSRSVPLGCTQIPLLTDYPDGIDTMEFLSRIQ